MRKDGADDGFCPRWATQDRGYAQELKVEGRARCTLGGLVDTVKAPGRSWGLGATPTGHGGTFPATQ